MCIRTIGRTGPGPCAARRARLTSNWTTFLRSELASLLVMANAPLPGPRRRVATSQVLSKLSPARNRPRAIKRMTSKPQNRSAESAIKERPFQARLALISWSAEGPRHCLDLASAGSNPLPNIRRGQAAMTYSVQTDRHTDRNDACRRALPSPVELIARAEAMIPVLRGRAADADRNEKLAPETMRELRDAGFFRILQPPAYGGYG